MGRRNRLRVTLALPALLMVALSTRAAGAESWYLMSADLQAMSNPKAAGLLARGSVVGPIHFTSSSAFASRQECESSRRKALEQWRHNSVIQRGGWGKHGITTPNAFVQCIADRDPRLAKIPAGGNADAPRTMAINLPVRTRRYR
jgi:hypothetical protein